MKRHHTQMAVNVTDGQRPEATPRRARHLKPLAHPGDEMHTLELVGKLDRASAPRLEAEIERLCDGGVGGITLDLRGVTNIDPAGVAVIVFRAKLCTNRGYEFALIEGPPAVQRAFELAGVAERLPFATARGRLV